MPNTKHTDAAKALAERLDPKKHADAAALRKSILKACRVKPRTLWTWIAATRRPSEHHRVTLERLAGVEWDDWRTAAEERAMDKAAERAARA